jgi:hypothetical protein
MTNLKWGKKPKNDLKDVMTFHNGEQNELKDITKNTETKVVWPIENHPLELWRIKIELETPWELMWNPTKKKTFWYDEIVVINPHAKKNENWLTLEANLWIVLVSGKRVFWWSTKCAILKDEYFKWSLKVYPKPRKFR